MSRRRKSADTTPFDTIRLEGSLFVPELLERAASGTAPAQKDSDYAIPLGLKIHDEYGRAFRIAVANGKAFTGQYSRADRNDTAITSQFVTDFLRQCLGYADLSPLSAPMTLGDRAFPISALASGGSLPVVIAPHHLGLDDPDPRFAIIGSGSKKKSAHQLAQEFLNASRDHLWAIVTNGKILRLVRDAETLTRPNFLEFDLETILSDDQQRYADFAALWRIMHASRAPTSSHCSAITDHSALSSCIWEQWKTEGHAQGLRVRNGLRIGVQDALLALGTGFLQHPANDALRQRLHDGSLKKEEYFQQLLRLIYRCLFLFCAEERDLLHAPENQSPSIDPQKARADYARGYSLRRLRSRSLRHSAHDTHGDLWIAMKIVFRSLARGEEKLALPALGGLFAAKQCPDLDDAALSNRDLLSAMRNLRWFFDQKSGKRSAIDYRNMGPEELGSVYESLLELIPTVDLSTRAFGFVGITDAGSTAGNTRKTTGSYYTPDSLVQELIKSALDPVIAQKIADHPEDPIAALLSITVCDPSCGSGHFLLAAGRRLAEKLAELRSADGAVRPDDYRHALREVASRCLYGVDINPMAVELCRVALWLETVDPGKPLGFLNHHIRHGNSLLGTTPDLIAAGLPDETFNAIEGDDKKACAELKKRNKKEREGFGPLFAQEEDSIREKLRQAATSIEAMDDSQPAALQQKEAAFQANETAPEFRHAKLLADLWCAAFVIKKQFLSSTDSPITNPEFQIASSSPSEITNPEFPIPQDDLFGQPVSAAKATAKPTSSLITDHRSLGTPVGITTGTLRDFVQGKPLPDNLASEVNQLAEQYRFFHWHLAFPQVFDKGGFACILGNPPWEMMECEKGELAADTFARHQHFYKCGNYAVLNGRRDLYKLFLVNGPHLLCVYGRLGMLTPLGVFIEDDASKWRAHLFNTGSVIRLSHYQNNQKSFFANVHASYRFCAITYASTTKADHEFTTVARNPEELGKVFPIWTPRSEFDEWLGVDRSATIYPNEGYALLHRVVANVIRRFPATTFRVVAEFHSSTDKGLLASTKPKDGWALLKNRNIYFFDYCYSPHEQWVPASEVVERSAKKGLDGKLWHTNFPRLVFRDIARNDDERTLISCLVPPGHVSTYDTPMFVPHCSEEQYPRWIAFFAATFSTFICDFQVRPFVDKHIKGYTLERIRWPSPVCIGSSCLSIEWIVARMLELVFVNDEFAHFAADCGWPGPPFRWDEDRRFLLRCELDAAFFHLYLGSEDEWRQQPEALTRAFPTPRHAVSYIMDTFPIVKRKDEAKHGTYRTKETILQIYDALTESIASGFAYQTQLVPVPTDPRIAHMPKLPDIPRTAFAAQDYFEVVLSLMLSMAPEGLERARLFLAIELLTDPVKRAKAARDLGDTGIQWSQAFREPYHFADAGKALITEVTKGRIRGVERMRLDPQAAVTSSNPWLCVDAFLALRLALQADVAVAQASEKTQKALVEQIIQFGKVA